MRKEIASPNMESDNFKEALRTFLAKESSVDEAFSAYARFIEETHNSKHTTSATHEIVWGQRSSKGNRIENVLLFLARVFTKTPASPIDPFYFKSLHRLDAQAFQLLRAEMERGVELENICSLSAGVSMWMFVLSVAMTPFVGVTGVALTIASILIFIGAVVGISKSHVRFLPDEIRNVSADYWSIKEISEK